jgi:hypothetical protein
MKALDSQVIKNDKNRPPRADVAGVRGISQESLEKYMNGILKTLHNFDWN